MQLKNQTKFQRVLEMHIQQVNTIVNILQFLK